MIFTLRNPFLGLCGSEYVYVLLNHTSAWWFSKKTVGIDLPTSYRWSVILLHSPALSIITLASFSNLREKHCAI